MHAAFGLAVSALSVAIGRIGCGCGPMPGPAGHPARNPARHHGWRPASRPRRASPALLAHRRVRRDLARWQRRADGGTAHRSGWTWVRARTPARRLWSRCLQLPEATKRDIERDAPSRIPALPVQLCGSISACRANGLRGSGSSRSRCRCQRGRCSRNVMFGRFPV